MAVDQFIKIGSLNGESKDKKYAKWIDVLAWSWGMSNSGSAHMGGGQGAGKCNVQDLSFTHYVDSCSADLQLATLNGKHFPEAKLIVRKAGENPLDYITITMTDLLVTSVSTGGAAGEDRITENVSLNFAKVKFEYKEQDAKGGGKAAGEYGFDIAGNAKI